MTIVFCNIKSDTLIRCDLPYKTEVEIENDFATNDKEKG